MKQPANERLQVLLTLAAQDTAGVVESSGCPDDATLSDFLENRLPAEARQSVLTHFQHCHDCYQTWQHCMTDLATLDSQPVSTAPNPLQQWWQTLVSGWAWSFKTASVAALGLLAVLITPAWLTLTPSLSAGIDADARLLAEAIPTVEHVSVYLEAESSWRAGFENTTSSDDFSQAFSAGVTQMRQTLSTPNLTDVSHTTGPADAYELGRWAYLVALAASQEMPSAAFWTRQRERVEALREALGTLTAESQATDAVSRLTQITPLLEKLPAPEQPNVYTQLQRRMEQFIQVLAAEG